MGHRMAVLSAGLLVMGVAACTTPYSSPKIDAQDGSSGAFEGIAAQLSPGQPLRVLYVHGMCSHDMRWVDDRSRRMATLLGVALTEPAPPDALSGAQLHRRSFVTPAGEATVMFVLWSPLTAGHKRALLFDAPEPDGQFRFKRATLNQRLKTGLLNDCLVDAVIYGGASGDPIRQAMRHALCEAFGGAFDPDQLQCTWPDDAAPRRVVLITESLGSKLLFDAVLSAYAAARAESPAQEAAFLRQIARTQYLYMIANQVPLLDRADREPAPEPAVAGFERIAPPSSSLGDFLAVRRAAQGMGEGAPEDVAPLLGPLTVVSFTDPNDLLSYRLVPEAIGTRDVRLINVIVSNAPTIAGWVERPDTAHMGYGDNRRVMRYLVEGHDGD